MHLIYGIQSGDEAVCWLNLLPDHEAKESMCLQS